MQKVATLVLGFSVLLTNQSVWASAEDGLHDSVDAAIARLMDLKEEQTINPAAFAKAYEASLILDRRLPSFAQKACVLSGDTNVDQCVDDKINAVAKALDHVLETEKIDDKGTPVLPSFKRVDEVCGLESSEVGRLLCMHNELNTREEKLMTAAAKISTDAIYTAGSGLALSEAYAETVTTLASKEKADWFIVKDKIMRFISLSMGLAD